MINLSKQLIEVKRSTAWLLNSCEGNYIEKLYYILGKICYACVAQNNK